MPADKDKGLFPPQLVVLVGVPPEIVSDALPSVNPLQETLVSVYKTIGES